MGHSHAIYQISMKRSGPPSWGQTSPLFDIRTAGGGSRGHGGANDGMAQVKRGLPLDHQ
jgi:hypothetical protein